MTVVDQSLAARAVISGDLLTMSRPGVAVIARQQADTAMGCQQFNLFPHLTARENVALGPIRVRGTDREHVFAEAAGHEGAGAGARGDDAGGDA